MKSFFPLVCALVLSAVSPSFAADTSAPGDSSALPGRYTPEQVVAFLNQYVGTWEGDYVIKTMDGQEVSRMSAQVTYRWETVGESQVLVGNAVYAVGEQMAMSTSRSYFWDGRLATEVEESGKKRVYLGVIDPAGESVGWNLANQEDYTRSGTKERFTYRGGKRVLLTEGYEDYQRGNQRRLFLLTSEMVRVSE